MRARTVAIWLAVVVAGAGGGALVGRATLPDRVDAGAAAPVPGEPALPTTSQTTVAPYSPDVDYPALSAPNGYTRYLLHGLQDWRFAAPKGWPAYAVGVGGSEQRVEDLGDAGEVRFRPEGAPTAGGYALRVKRVDDHLPPSSMVLNKLRQLETLTDFNLLRDPTDDAIYFTYRTRSSNLLRYNYFRWFAAPDSTEATLEMSVVGRKIDEDGLYGLFAAFAARLEPVE